MMQTILFDLDDTLLGNHMDSFLPSYFTLLGNYAAPLMPKETFLQELMLCTQAMVQNVDSTVSNRDVFWQLFEQRTGLDADEVEPFFDQFYRQQFDRLEATTEKRPFAAKLVQHCQKVGLDVVIATNPLFPRVAIEARLAWAGLPVNDYDFELVTTYENMHATKPHPAYYTEILQKIGCAPKDALMVGDSWENDIEPAASLGLHTYWLAAENAPRPKRIATYRGTSLQDLYVLLAAGWRPT